MIKLVLPEDQPPQPERTVHFEFRRHKQADKTSALNNLVFLVGYDSTNTTFGNEHVYPIKIDGNTKTVEIREADFEKLGFKVVVKQ